MMTGDWLPAETNTHQDHVIAHVLGATVLGYFRADETAHFMLDIGFIWSILLDGEMGLVPQRMAFAELPLSADERATISADAEALHEHGAAATLARVTAAPAECLITAVEFYTNERGRRLLLLSADASLCVETELATGTITITPLRAA